MLAIRMQRIGRRGTAHFRIVVQDARKSPKSGKLVAHLGNYNPHSKQLNLDADKTKLFLKNGARPSNKTALLLKKEGIKLPKWVNVKTNKAGQPKKDGSSKPAQAAAGANDQPAPEEATKTQTKADTKETAEVPAASADTTPTEDEAEPAGPAS
jgi:small subunit ribosomal protein S16